MSTFYGLQVQLSALPALGVFFLNLILVPCMGNKAKVMGSSERACREGFLLTPTLMPRRGDGEGGGEMTARQRARMADLSLLLEVVLKTNGARREFCRCGVLHQLQARLHLVLQVLADQGLTICTGPANEHVSHELSHALMYLRRLLHVLTLSMLHRCACGSSCP